MLRLLAFATLFMLTAFAVNVQAEDNGCGTDQAYCYDAGPECVSEDGSQTQCDMSSPECGDCEPVGAGCDQEACVFDDGGCIHCSTPLESIDGREDCENCRSNGADKEKVDTPGFEAIGLLAILGAILMLRRK